MKIYTLNSQEVVLKTIEKIFLILKPTYGVNGKGVIIGGIATANVIDDGFKILEALEFEDPYENDVLLIIKEATRRMNAIAGDGTTTVIMFLYALLKEFYALGKQEIDPSHLMDAVNKVCNQLVAESHKPSGIKDLHKIAINAFNHPEIAGLVATVVDDVGGEGEIALRESDDSESSIERQQGFTFDRGMVNQYMYNKPDGSAVLLNPLILVTDRQVLSLQELLPLVKLVVEDGARSLLIIADTVDGGALNLLLSNKAKNLLSSVAVKAPFAGERKKTFFEDVALITGASVITSDKGVLLKNATLAHLGTAERVIITDSKTVIIKGEGRDHDIKQKVQELKKVVLSDEYDKENMAQRISQLTNSVAVLKVGGITEPERKYLLEKADDCIKATQLAVREGISPGAGLSFSEADTGLEWFDKALAFPRSVLEGNGGMTNEKVFDPTGVLVAVVQTATSIALTLIRSSGIITQKEQ